jgi:hypothetical protein
MRVVGDGTRSRTKVACEGMFHRFSTWWRALSVVLLCLATVTWPTAAQAGTTPTFSIIHQDAVAALSAKGTTHFSLTLATKPKGVASRARVTMYPRVIDRSQLSPIISGAGVTDRAMSTTSTFTLRCEIHGTFTFTVDLFTGRTGSLRRTCYPVTPHMRLACRGQSCDGVYPIRIEVTTNGVSNVIWSLLAVQATSVDQPLLVDYVETMDPSSWLHAKRSIQVLDTIGHHPMSSITLSADYRTLNTVAQTGTNNALFRAALNKALTSPLHQAIDAPPANIDFAALAEHGLGVEVGHQLNLSSALLKDLTGRYVDSPVLLTGAPSVNSLKALRHAGVSDVVLPENDVAIPPSTTLNWGAPFNVGGAGPITVLSSDSELSALVQDSSINPGRRAALTLGTLAFLHFEAPDAPSSRTVVILAPVAQTSVKFLNDVLRGFAVNPFVTLATLAPSFDTTLVGTNGAPATRALAAPPTSKWSSQNVSSLSTLVNNVNAFSQAVKSSNLGNDLEVATEASEITGDPSRRQTSINAAANALHGQLTNFRVDPSTITLAGSGTSIPITLFSHANYTVVANVHLLTDQITFPKGDNVPIKMDSPTKSVRIATSGHNGSSLTLQVIVTTPNNRLVLARAAIQVRIAGTSIVGYFLTIASLLVLAWWWVRTYRRRPKGRHAR